MGQIGVPIPTDPHATVPGKPSLLAGMPRPRSQTGGSPLTHQSQPPAEKKSRPNSTVMGMALISPATLARATEAAEAAEVAAPVDQTLPQRPSAKAASIQTLATFDHHPPDQGAVANTQPEVVPAVAPVAAAAPGPEPVTVATQSLAAAASGAEPIDPTAVTLPHERSSVAPATIPRAARSVSVSPTRASGPTSALLGEAGESAGGFFTVTPAKIIIGLVLCGATYLLLSNAHIELFPCLRLEGTPPVATDSICSLLGANDPDITITGAGWGVVGAICGLLPMLLGFGVGEMFRRRR